MLKEFLEIMAMLIGMLTLISIADSLNRIYRVLLVIKAVIKETK